MKQLFSSKVLLTQGPFQTRILWMNLDSGLETLKIWVKQSLMLGAEYSLGMHLVQLVEKP